MHAAPNILVLRHPDDPFDRTSYVIRALIDEWRRRGMTVAVTDRTTYEKIDEGTLVIPHLDLTRTPAAYQRFIERCPKVVNRAVMDISKRRISRNLVTSPRQFDGAVIVKPNRNACGEPERSKLRRSGRVGWMMSQAMARLPWTLTAQIGSPGYRIYERSRDVPWVVWHNPRLVIEKFLPERQGDQYCLRQYVFFGDREINTLAVSPEPIVKAWNVTRRELLSETPPALRVMRASLGFDFGKFDYVIRNGEVVLFDTNRTPTYNAASKAGSPSQLVLDLANGIEAFTRTAA